MTSKPIIVSCKLATKLLISLHMAANLHFCSPHNNYDKNVFNNLNHHMRFWY